MISANRHKIIIKIHILLLNWRYIIAKIVPANDRYRQNPKRFQQSFLSFLKNILPNGWENVGPHGKIYQEPILLFVKAKVDAKGVYTGHPLIVMCPPHVPDPQSSCCIPSSSPRPGFLVHQKMSSLWIRIFLK